jgi:predicted transposase YbfD/YdcC
MLLRSQKSIAQKIIAADSDYVLSLKDNHPTLHQQVKNWFETAQSNGFKDVDVSMSQRIEKAKSSWGRFPSTKLFQTGQ